MIELRKSFPSHFNLKSSEPERIGTETEYVNSIAFNTGRIVPKLPNTRPIIMFSFYNQAVQANLS